MPTPHYNYYPPAGAVIDATDSRVTWNGKGHIVMPDAPGLGVNVDEKLVRELGRRK